MTKLQITKDFIIKTIIPILFAILLYSMFINLCTDSAGTVDYIKLFILCGIPFGITRLIVFPLFGLNGMLATLIFSFFIGGAIGGIILIWRLLVALYYIPLTVVRFVAAR